MLFLNQEIPISAARDSRTPDQRGSVIWLTGRPAAGKTTVARGLERRLVEAGIPTRVLDGDEIRTRLCRDLGYSDVDRNENVRRVAEHAMLLAEEGVVVLVALISPFRAGRQRAAENGRARGIRFVEVYVNAPLEECERRDPKGLYRRARRGEIAVFTGVDSAYEPPLNPALELRTDRETIEQSVARVTALAIDLARGRG